MSHTGSPEQQLAWLQALASGLPEGGEITMALSWVNDHGEAAISISPEGCAVSLFGEVLDVTTASEARDVMGAILRDEIVAVRGYRDEVFVFGGLAPVADPSALLNQVSARNGPKGSHGADYVVIGAWSMGFAENEE